MAKKKNKDKLKDYTEEADRKEVVQMYYEFAILDYKAGLGIEHINNQLKYAEQEELYLVCAGIHKAIKEIENKSK